MYITIVMKYLHVLLWDFAKLRACSCGGNVIHSNLATHVAPKLRFGTPSLHEHASTLRNKRVAGAMQKFPQLNDLGRVGFMLIWGLKEGVCVYCGGRCAIAPLVRASNETGIAKGSLLDGLGGSLA